MLEQEDKRQRQRKGVEAFKCQKGHKSTIKVSENKTYDVIALFTIF